MLIQQNKMPVQESAMPVKLRLRLRKPMQCLQCNACAKPVDQRNPWITSRTYGFHEIHAIPGIQCLYSRARCLSNRIQCLWTPHGACAMQCNAMPVEQSQCTRIWYLSSYCLRTEQQALATDRGDASLQRLSRFRETPQMTQNPSTEPPRWINDQI